MGDGQRGHWVTTSWDYAGRPNGSRWVPEQDADTSRYTERALKVLSFAVREALARGHNYIAPEHLQAALNREELEQYSNDMHEHDPSKGRWCGCCRCVAMHAEERARKAEATLESLGKKVR